jgi:hypothetical protein
MWSSTLDEREQIRIDPAISLVVECVRSAGVSSGATRLRKSSTIFLEVDFFITSSRLV